MVQESDSMSRLPVYLLLDTSGSMRGEPINSVNVGIRAMLDGMRHDSYALESVSLSIITFDNEARVYLPLTPLDKVWIPDIRVPNAGATFTGAALELLLEEMERQVCKSTEETKVSWKPLLFLMTDGAPSDLYTYRQAISRIKAHNFGMVVAYAAGPKAKIDLLKELTDHVVSLDIMDSVAFLGFLKWVSASASTGSITADILHQSPNDQDKR